MKAIKTLKTKDNVILFYRFIPAYQDTTMVVIGNKTIYEGKTEWLVRGDYSDYAQYMGVYDLKPIGWIPLEGSE